MHFLKFISITFLFIISQTAFSAGELPPPTLNQSKTTLPPEATVEPPTLPLSEDDSRNIPQPEVRIIRKKDVVIEEYRVNGQLRFIKITPTTGSPYYMVDTDGDGVLETREDNFANPPINQWILLEW